jgi:hypothetical protein
MQFWTLTLTPLKNLAKACFYSASRKGANSSSGLSYSHPRRFALSTSVTEFRYYDVTPHFCRSSEEDFGSEVWLARK